MRAATLLPDGPSTGAIAQTVALHRDPLGTLRRLRALVRDERAMRDDAVVDETLRLRPAAIAALRRLTEDRDVARHRLPAGVTVMLPIPVLQCDPGVYPRPDACEPDRWRSPSPPTAFWPFGGTRRCIGELLARAYFETVVPAILDSVRLRPLWPRFERMVLRGTILGPHRGALMIAG